jgi:hypothetical protein
VSNEFFEEGNACFDNDEFNVALEKAGYNDPKTLAKLINKKGFCYNEQEKFVFTL